MYWIYNLVMLFLFGGCFYVLWIKYVFMNINWFVFCLIDNFVIKSMFVLLLDMFSLVNEII